MKRFWILPILLFLLAGCSYNYFSKRENRKSKDAATTSVGRSQIAQLRLQDSLWFNNGRTVSIHPLMCNKSGTGVYGYNSTMIHFGHVNYFLYRNDSLIRISRENKDSLFTTVEQFLTENDFSKHQIKVAMKKMRSTYEINVTDVF